MVNLLYFLNRYGSLLCFLFLEMISLYLIVQYNQKQKDIYLNSSRYYSGVLLEKTTNLTQYIGLKGAADSLAKENAQLYTRLYNQLSLNPEQGVSDSALITFSYLPAWIIKKNVHLPNNNFTLNKGRKDGVLPGMGVMLPNGILGVIMSSSTHYSRVLSVLSSQSYISALVKRNEALGTLTWDGEDPRFLVMKEVPKYMDLLKGDTITTSGFSAVFPKGIPIGVVENYFIPPGSSSYQIKVNMFADLIKSNQVYIIQNLGLDEMSELEAKEQ